MRLYGSLSFLISVIDFFFNSVVERVRAPGHMYTISTMADCQLHASELFHYLNYANDVYTSDKND